MKLGKTIYNEQGHVLAGRGFVLTPQALVRLQQLQIPFLYIDEQGTEDILPEQSISDETLVELHAAMTYVMNQLAYEPADVLPDSVVKICHDAVKVLAEDLRRRKNPLCLPIHLNTALPSGDKRHFLEHALNVGVCATQLVYQEGVGNEELHAMALGAMLHDIGRLLLPGKLEQNKRSKGFESHTELGFLLLRNSGFPSLTAQCALFHHERFDGKGYPFGLQGAKIHPLIQWVSIVDRFDTLVHGRGPMEAMLPHEALEIIYGGAGTEFDMQKVCRLRDRLLLFPTGTTVRLSSGEVGVVSEVREECKQRPVVRIIRNRDGVALEKPYEVDLKQNLHLVICGVGDR
jgi:putative nucleotidyltransferase with HDIG domain